MARFQDAIDYVIANEIDPGQPCKTTIDNDGGVVKFGLNTRSNPDLTYKYGDRLQRLTLEMAKAEYELRYWLPIMEELASQRVATKLLDMMVNQGRGDAINHLQLAVGLIHPTAHFGPVTLQNANKIYENQLLDELAEQARLHYLEVEEHHPEWKKYDHVWMERAKKLP